MSNRLYSIGELIIKATIYSTSEESEHTFSFNSTGSYVHLTGIVFYKNIASWQKINRILSFSLHFTVMSYIRKCVILTYEEF